MAFEEYRRRNGEPVTAAEALLAHHITDQAILRYLKDRWGLDSSDAISALAAARAFAEHPEARTALPRDGV